MPYLLLHNERSGTGYPTSSQASVCVCCVCARKRRQITTKGSVSSGVRVAEEEDETPHGKGTFDSEYIAPTAVSSRRKIMKVLAYLADMQLHPRHCASRARHSLPGHPRLRAAAITIPLRAVKESPLSRCIDKIVRAPKFQHRMFEKESALTAPR